MAAVTRVNAAVIWSAKSPRQVVLGITGHILHHRATNPTPLSLKTVYRQSCAEKPCREH